MPIWSGATGLVISAVSCRRRSGRRTEGLGDVECKILSDRYPVNLQMRLVDDRIERMSVLAQMLREELFIVEKKSYGVFVFSEGRVKIL